jgi:uncharacterized protein YhfF
MSIIRKLESRHMEGYYCADSAQAQEKILELIGSGSKSVAYGGSMTIDHMGIKEKITEAGHRLIIREDYKTPESIIKVADGRMYYGKQHGKNIVVYEDH